MSGNQMSSQDIIYCHLESQSTVGQDVFIAVACISQRQEGDLKPGIPHILYTPAFLSLTDL